MDLRVFAAGQIIFDDGADKVVIRKLFFIHKLGVSNRSIIKRLYPIYCIAASSLRQQSQSLCTGFVGVMHTAYCGALAGAEADLAALALAGALPALLPNHF